MTPHLKDQLLSLTLSIISYVIVSFYLVLCKESFSGRSSSFAYLQINRAGTSLVVYYLQLRELRYQVTFVFDFTLIHDHRRFAVV